MAQQRLTLAAVRALAGALCTGLEALATEGLSAGALATAFGVSPAPLAPVASVPPQETLTLLASGQSRWTRIELALGMELHFREDAKIQDLAR